MAGGTRLQLCVLFTDCKNFLQSACITSIIKKIKEKRNVYNLKKHNKQKNWHSL